MENLGSHNSGGNIAKHSSQACCSNGEWSQYRNDFFSSSCNGSPKSHDTTSLKISENSENKWIYKCLLLMYFKIVDVLQLDPPR